MPFAVRSRIPTLSSAHAADRSGAIRDQAETRRAVGRAIALSAYGSLEEALMDIQADFDFDVFISYSSHDKAWVRGELLTRIEQAGLKAFLDYRDFARGAPSIKECERGVEKCRKTLMVLTPNYIASEWCEFEGVMVQTLSPANRDLRLIPLLKAKCEKPLRIGRARYTGRASRSCGRNQRLACWAA